VPIAIDSLPDDIEALKRLVLEREEALEIERHNVRTQQTLIEHLKLQIARLKRLQFGQRSEKLQAQIEQLELIVEDLEESQAQQAPAAVPESRPAKQPVRRALPEHLPRETVRHEPEPGCPDCGGGLRSIGEEVAEVLEYVPASFKVIRHVRPRMACSC
jgi:transposase